MSKTGNVDGHNTTVTTPNVRDGLLKSRRSSLKPRPSGFFTFPPIPYSRRWNDRRGRATHRGSPLLSLPVLLPFLAFIRRRPSLPSLPPSLLGLLRPRNDRDREEGASDR